MYNSRMHQVLVESIKNTIWVKSTKNEDNFRQVLCSSLYTHISPSNLSIPSTRSGGGDIEIFGRKIEIKYANAEKK